LSSPDTTIPNKMQKILCPLPVYPDSTNKSAAGEGVTEVVSLQHDCPNSENGLTVNEAAQQAWVEELGMLMRDPRLLCAAGANSQNPNLPGADLNGKGSADPGLANHDLPSNVQLLSDGIDHDFFERLCRLDVINQPSSNAHGTNVETQEHDSFLLDFPSSPILQPIQQPPIPQAVRSRTASTPRQPPNIPEVVKVFETGMAYPQGYLSLVRSHVDPDFSNDNWGEAYYSDNAPRFTHLEDLKPNAQQGIDNHAIMEGLRRQAAAVPERTERAIWKSFEVSLQQSVNGGRDPHHDDFTPTSIEARQRRIQEVINQIACRPLAPDLEPRIQEKKIAHIRNSLGPKVPQSPHLSKKTEPAILGGMPTRATKYDSNTRVGKEKLDEDVDLQERVKQAVDALCASMTFKTPPEASQ
jgi:hypothetical protein